MRPLLIHFIQHYSYTPSNMSPNCRLCFVTMDCVLLQEAQSRCSHHKEQIDNGRSYEKQIDQNGCLNTLPHNMNFTRQLNCFTFQRLADLHEVTFSDKTLKERILSLEYNMKCPKFKSPLRQRRVNLQRRSYAPS